MVEIRPIHRHEGDASPVHLVRYPPRKAVPHVNAAVAEQPVHLLDRVLGHQAARLGQSLADHRHRERCRRHHPKRGARQRVDPFGMQVRPIHLADKRPHFAQTPTSLTRLAHVDAPAPFEPKPLRNPREPGLCRR